MHGDHQARVLIVDDKTENRLLLKKIIEPLGFIVREAENGNQAVEIWETWSPNIILMDMRMPVMDGYEATRRIKSTTKGQATVIIAVTASALEEDRDVILSEGCDAYIRKPFRESEIFDEFEKHLGIKFLYDSTSKELPISSTAQRSLNIQAELSHISTTQMKNLRHAVATGDITLINQLLDDISNQLPHLQEQLQELVERYEFDQLLEQLDMNIHSRRSKL